MEIRVGRGEVGGETRVFIEGVLDAVTVTEVKSALEAVVADQTRTLQASPRQQLLVRRHGCHAAAAGHPEAAEP